MFDDECDCGQYFVWRYEEERLILAMSQIKCQRILRWRWPTKSMNFIKPQSLNIISVCYTDLFINYITFNYVYMCLRHGVYSIIYTALTPLTNIYLCSQVWCSQLWSFVRKC